MGVFVEDPLLILVSKDWKHKMQETWSDVEEKQDPCKNVQILVALISSLLT